MNFHFETKKNDTGSEHILRFRDRFSLYFEITCTPRRLKNLNGVIHNLHKVGEVI